MKWFVIIHGEESSISMLSSIIPSSEGSILEKEVDNKKEYYLYSSRFESLASADDIEEVSLRANIEEVRLRATEIIQDIDQESLIKIAAICRESEDGKIKCNHLHSGANIKLDNSSATIERLEMLSPLSFSHIKASAHLAKLSYDIETADDGERPSELFYVHRAYVIGSIITAASYLEASINECLAAIKEGNSSIQLSADDAAEMESGWENIQKKKSILEKYQYALTIGQKILFDPGSEPYQSASYLNQLRNGLVHYKPEWVGTGEGYEQTFSEKLRKKLENRIKRLNPLADAGDCAFFPHKCLGYGCAKWAVESSIKFTDEFFSKMGLPSNLNENDRSSLNLPEIS